MMRHVPRRSRYPSAGTSNTASPSVSVTGPSAGVVSLGSTMTRSGDAVPERPRASGSMSAWKRASMSAATRFASARNVFPRTPMTGSSLVASTSMGSGNSIVVWKSAGWPLASACCVRS